MAERLDPGYRVAVWLGPRRLDKLARAQALLALRLGRMPLRPQAVEFALDELLDLLETQSAGGDSS